MVEHLKLIGLVFLKHLETSVLKLQVTLHLLSREIVRLRE